MSDQARRGYGMLARLFLLVGGAFTLLALLQMAGVIRFFQGNPLGVALIVLAVGVLLWWTVRTAPPPSDEGEAIEDASQGNAGASGGRPVRDTSDDASGSEPRDDRGR